MIDFNREPPEEDNSKTILYYLKRNADSENMESEKTGAMVRETKRRKNLNIVVKGIDSDDKTLFARLSKEGITQFPCLVVNGRTKYFGLHEIEGYLDSIDAYHYPGLEGFKGPFPQ